MSSNISGNLSVSGNSVMNVVTASNITATNINATNLNASALNATINNLTVPNLISNNITNSGNITTPQLVINSKNIGTSLQTLEDKNVVDRVNISNLQVKTTNINYNSTSLTTTLNGLIDCPNSLIVNNVIANNKTISNVELSYLDNCSSEIQAQFDGVGSRVTTLENKTSGIIYNSVGDLTTIDNNLTLTKNLNLNANIVASGSTISAAELACIDGISSNIQTQINNASTRLTNIETNISGISYASTGDITTIDNNLTLTKNLNLGASSNIVINGLTISGSELGFIDGVSSNIQTQLNNSSSRVSNIESTLTDISYNSASDTTTINNNVLVGKNVTCENFSGEFFNIRDMDNKNTSSILYHQNKFLILSNEEAGGLLAFACKDTNNNTVTTMHMNSGNFGFFIGIHVPSIILNGVNLDTRIANVEAQNDIIKGCGIYLLDGSNKNVEIPSRTHAVLCSLPHVADYDDAWIIYPGFKVELYANRDYFLTQIGDGMPWSTTGTGLTGVNIIDGNRRTIDNTTGTSPIIRRSVDIYGAVNGVGSVKVFFRNVEFTLPFIS